MYKNSIFSILLLCLIFSFFSQAQTQSSSKVLDTHEIKTYGELKILITDKSTTDSISKIYANKYLRKAKIENNQLQIAAGYDFLRQYEKNDQSKIRYLDSIIKLTKKTRDSCYPERAFFYRGIIYHTNEKFKRALDDYISANEFAKEKGNQKVIQNTSFNIGILKNKMGDYEEALPYFKKYYQDLTYQNTNITSKNLPIIIFNLASSYRHTGKLDSASFYYKKGFELAKVQKDTLWYYQFIYNKGINEYYQENYNEAIDSIKKVIPHYIEEKSDENLMAAYAYLGKSLLKLKKTSEAIDYLEKSTVLFKETKYISPELRDIHEILINHYKEKNDDKNHLKHLIILKEFDSILQSDYKYLTKKIFTKYEQPQLIEEREEIISILKDRQKELTSLTKWLFIFLTLATLLITYFILRHHRYKKRFNTFIQKYDQLSGKNLNRIAPKSTNVPKKIINEIVNNLKAFENNEEFTDHTLTLGSLAKKLKTNSKYLSLVINEHEQKSFRIYLNDLRIKYTIDKLRINKTYRKYAVKAIASEVGFNNSETFSKAFYRYTGVYPSFFIKQLEKL